MGKGGKERKKLPQVREEPKRPHEIRAGALPQEGKHVRYGAQPVNYQSQRISWHLGELDFGGPYCFSVLGFGGIPALIEKLKDFESRTWGEILGAQSHAVATEALSRDGARRLTALRLDDVDELISLRFSGKERVFGLRDGAILRVLWWDPDHEVCPSELKHT